MAEPTQGAREAVWRAITDYCEAERGNATFVAAEASVDAALTAFAEAVAAAERERIRAVVMALKANGGWGEALAADTILEALRAPADEGGAR